MPEGIAVAVALGGRGPRGKKRDPGAQGEDSEATAHRYWRRSFDAWPRLMPCPTMRRFNSTKDSP